MSRKAVVLFFAVFCVSLGFSLTVDGFEDGTLSEYSGDKGYFNVQSSTVKEGTYALKYSDTSSWSSITSSSGLDNYPDRGGNITFWFYTGNELQFCFGVQDDGGSYCLKPTENNLDTQLRKDGNVLDNTGEGPPLNQWIYNIVQWKENGDIIWEMEYSDGSDYTVLEATDTDYDSGDISIRANFDTGYFDSIEYHPNNEAPVVESKSYSPSTVNAGDSVSYTMNASDSDGDSLSAWLSVTEDGTDLVSNKSMGFSDGLFELDSAVTPDSAETWYNASFRVSDGKLNTTAEASFYMKNTSLSWSHSGSADGYRIYSNATGGGMTQVADISSKSYEHISTALDSGNYVCYEVVAYNQYGESDPESKCSTLS